jgi:hypothetical protein
MIFTEKNEAFVGWPHLFVSSEDQIHLIYALEENKARGYRVSNDNGETWQDEEIILQEMEGINGYVFPLEDAGANLHLIVNMRPLATQETGLYHALYIGNRWFPVVPVALREPYGPSAHYTAGTARLGNELHIVWTDLGAGEIWYIRGLIPSVTAVSPISPVSETMQTTTTNELLTSPADEQPVAPASLVFDQESGPGKTFSLAPLFSSIAGALLIIVPFLIWRRVHR